MARTASIVPTGRALVDLLFVLGLGTIAMYGFKDTFHGWTFLLAGVLGLVLGAVLAHLAVELAQPVVVLALFVVVAFFLLGGAIAGPHSAASALPLPGTLIDLADKSVHGWKELLTTLPPVDGGPLLALPYLLGLVAGAGTLTLARRLRSAWVPLVGALALVAAVILLGVQDAQHLAITGLLVAVLGIAWVVIRSRWQSATVTIGSRNRSRVLLGAGLCGLAALGAVVVGPHLPGTSEDRTVLRTWVEPPFDVGQYPSPLASFRKYTKDYSGPSQYKLHDKPLLEVKGLPEGTRIRFAGMDSYNGIVFGAANDSGLEPGNADTFQKVGSVIANPATGKAVSAQVKVLDGYRGVWLPEAGALTGIKLGTGLSGQVDSFRYNLATDTGVIPGGIEPGDTYTFNAVLPDDKLDKGLTTWAGSLPGVEAASRFQSLAAQMAGQTASTPLERVIEIAKEMKATGKYTDGGAGAEQFRPGHSLSRLSEFTSADHQMAGDDEQYAAMMAILANQAGVPARVVMGAKVPASGIIAGKDVHAWVELRAADGTWRTLTQEDFMSDTPPEQEAPQREKLVAGKVIPPPAPVRPPSSAGDPVEDSLDRLDQHHSSAFQVPGFVWWILKWVVLPLLVAAALVGLVLFLKRRRTRLRRTTGTAAARVAAAWRDLLDHARDHGHAVSGRATRREQAAAIPVDGFRDVASSADAGVFGRTDPTEEQAEHVWKQVDEQRARMNEPLSRLARWKVALNLTSFRRLEGASK
ncbi:transglutaminase-like domain-containing protein [Nocardioides jejuensis]|uniref:Transglutaminase domain-containing protein n=1 Tax=Nocardioides jejuensis TaxID=2502782 RepID=A0A4R1CGW0_9ACTN|nr:transglutaminase-like domain-containing protein [Nocardioides jejuensis]TCJ30191.1 transglutaminase domain-containing protein [Nocardioides jejuensis]